MHDTHTLGYSTTFRRIVTDNLSKLDRHWLVTTFAWKIERNSKVGAASKILDFVSERCMAIDTRNISHKFCYTYNTSPTECLIISYFIAVSVNIWKNERQLYNL